MFVYEIWCEWDLGLSNTVFSSEDKALEWLDNNWDSSSIEMTQEEAVNESLLGIEALRVDP